MPRAKSKLIPLGAEVTVGYTLEREAIQAAPGVPYRDYWKVWKRKFYPPGCYGDPPPCEGIVIGFRCVFDGYRVPGSPIDVDGDDGGEPPVFVQKKTHRVYLVVTGLRRKPLVVPAEYLEEQCKRTKGTE